MPFSLGGGLSEMGRSIADTAGRMSLEAQRAQLDQERAQLASQLAEGRDERSDIRKGMINQQAATQEQGFRSSENEKNRQTDKELADMRERGANSRALLSAETDLKRRAMSEAAADSRFNRELDLKVKQAKEAARSAEEKRILDSAIAAATTTVEQPYTTADGERATRPVKIFNAEKAAGILRDTGHENLANPLFPKPVKKANVTGKPKPPLDSFLNGD